MVSSRRSILVWGLLALLPWWWFVIRDWSPLLDIVAILWPPLIAGLVVTLALGAAVLRRRGLLLVGASCALLRVAGVLEQWVPANDPPPMAGLRVTSVNVLGDNRAYRDLVAELIAHDPDVLVALEVSARVHDPLTAHFPYRSRARDAEVAVYSRYPMTPIQEPPTVVEDFGEAVRIDAPSGQFVVYAVHLPKPGVDRVPEANDLRGGPRDVPPGRQREIADALAQAADAESLPVVIAGDLNLPDRVEGYRELSSQLRDAMRSDWVGPTSKKWGPLLVRIDHIFVSRDWCSRDSRRFDARGSDHLAVSTVVGPCALDTEVRR